MSNSRRWRRVNKMFGWDNAFNRAESKALKRWNLTVDDRHHYLDMDLADELKQYSKRLSENAKRINKIPDEGDFCVIVNRGLHGYPIGEVVKIQTRFLTLDDRFEAISYDGLEQIIKCNDVKVITPTEAFQEWESNYAEI